jgi:hypothetical protein
LQDNLQQLSKDMKSTKGTERLQNYIGIGIILFGAWLLAAQFLPRLLALNWRYVWPTALIGIGIFILVNKRSS